jgi:AcrR family transcriptional regulator
MLKIDAASSRPTETHRRVAVMESALTTFARYGYRKTSMDEVAKAAQISRPGLYFLFSSKEELFRAAVSHALQSDVADVEKILARNDRPIRDRLIDAFSCWAGRYIGPMAKDVASVIDENPDLLGEIVRVFPQHFAKLIEGSLISSGSLADRELASALTQTMVSLSVGLKYQVDDRQSYIDRFSVALDLLLRR